MESTTWSPFAKMSRRPWCTANRPPEMMDCEKDFDISTHRGTAINPASYSAFFFHKHPAVVISYTPLKSPRSQEAVVIVGMAKSLAPRGSMHILLAMLPEKETTFRPCPRLSPEPKLTSHLSVHPHLVLLQITYGQQSVVNFAASLSPPGVGKGPGQVI